MEEGIKLSLLWTRLEFSVETDCADALELIKKGTPNMSIYAFRVAAIRDLFQERGTVTAKINHDANGVAHELARMGRL